MRASAHRCVAQPRRDAASGVVAGGSIAYTEHDDAHEAGEVCRGRIDPIRGSSRAIVEKAHTLCGWARPGKDVPCELLLHF